MENEISNLPEFSVRKVGQNYTSWLRRGIGYVISYLCLAVLTYGFFQFSHRYLIQTVQIDGVSMSPTLQNAQCFFLNRVIYLIRDPRPQDIVVLRDPETNGSAIKRIVARPGDCVYVKGGQLFVNGE